ncbi:MAG: thiamine transport system permease protein [Parvicella sp.]|jgi:thiamine transport system permease protein
MSASRRQALLRPHYLGYVALALLLGPTILAFAALSGFDKQGLDWGLLKDPYLQGVLWFSLKQAALSALLSVLIALPIARALYYVPALPGRRAFLKLCLLCFVLPTLVLLTGLVVLLGHAGWLSPLLGEEWNLYGLHGILLAHIFLNMPFAVRVLFQQLQTIPDSSWKLATQLKLSPRRRWQTIEWPVLQGALPLLMGFIFLLCFNSFAVVLALGGGPQATTLEVAIYQALKYDFNISEALTLASLQLIIAGSLFLLMVRLGSVKWLSVDTTQTQNRPRAGQMARIGHTLLYFVSAGFLLLPLLALLPGLLAVDANTWQNLSILKPLLATLSLGIGCALIALVLTYLVLLPSRNARLQTNKHLQWLLEWLATHTLVAPAMVLSVGLYVFALIKLPGQVDELFWSVLFTVLLIVLVIVPFAVQQVRPRLLQFDDQYSRLCASLNLSPVQRLKVEWSWWKKARMSAFSLIAVLAMGDVTAFSIFGTSDWITMPWLIYSYAGTYRMAEASVIAFLLLLICMAVVWLFERSQVAPVQNEPTRSPTHRERNNA